MPPHPTPTPTILTLALPPSTFCTLDLQPFTTPSTTTHTFHGIRDIPPGLHFFLTAETTSVSLRSGFWFQTPLPGSTPAVVVRRWDEAQGALAAVKDESGVDEEVWDPAGLSPYRQPDGDEGGEVWRELVAHVTPAVLTRLLRGKEWEISSSSSVPQDRDEIPGVSEEETGLEEWELGGLGIDLRRTWKEGAVGRERTEGARDWSWALEDVVERAGGGGWEEVVLGQMEVCFLMVLTVGNYSCLEEWKRCVGLVLGCRRAVGEKGEFFEEFLKVLARQVERFEDVEGGVFDMSDEGAGLLKGWLRKFRRTLGEVFQEGEGAGVKAGMGELLSVLKRIYAWDLEDDFVKKGMVQLEDGEMVELEVGHMHGEDEDADYAPVVVDMNDT